ncbi:MAG: hypothetical protein HY885_16125 [Deltaproteobacteria bacterium]|nr:hypothetical protein [Deltaproteobacteria bacterium]
MNKNNESAKILEIKKFPNGIEVRFADLSRKLAGDRWLVKVKCEAVLDVREEWFADIDDAELAAAMKLDCAGRVRHAIYRERNFVDAHDKDRIVEEIFRHFQENALTYMSGEVFPRKLFKNKVEAFGLRYRIEKEMSVSSAPDEDDDGPADFSGCFRD